MAGERTMPIAPTSRRRTRAGGFSLVELMVAITLGLLLIGGMIQLFSSTKVTFNTNDALARVQENGRFALSQLKRDLRAVGDASFCGGDIELTNHLNQDCSEFDDDTIFGNTGISGWEYSGTGRTDDFDVPADLDPSGTSAGDWSTIGGGGLPEALAGRVAPGSDVLIVRTFAPTGYIIDQVSNNNRIALDTRADCQQPGCRDPRPGELILVTNCATGADLFQQSKAQSLESGLRKPNMNCSSQGPGNKPPGPNPWSTQYDESAQVFSIGQSAYFVGYSAERDQPGLYRLDLARDEAVELVEGVESMQVLYGFSNDSASGGTGQTVDAWLAADEIPAGGMGQVIAARVALMLRSPEAADPDRSGTAVELFSEDDALKTVLVSPGDGRIRHAFSTTVALRNQMIIVDNLPSGENS
jgi:type IV pilus assembly protein PilW